MKRILITFAALLLTPALSVTLTSQNDLMFLNSGDDEGGALINSGDDGSDGGVVLNGDDGGDTPDVETLVDPGAQDLEYADINCTWQGQNVKVRIVRSPYAETFFGWTYNYALGATPYGDYYVPKANLSTYVENGKNVLDLSQVDPTQTKPYKSVAFDITAALRYARKITKASLLSNHLNAVDVCKLYPPPPPGCIEKGCNDTPCALKFFSNGSQCPQGKAKLDTGNVGTYLSQNLDY